MRAGFSEWLVAAERQHGRSLMVIAVVTVAAVALLLAVVLMMDRLRQGVVIGMLPVIAIFTVAIVACWRAGAKTLSVRLAIVFVGALLVPAVEVAAYVVHSAQFGGVREAARTAEDADAIRTYFSVPRVKRDGITVLEPVATPAFNINADGFRGPSFETQRAASRRIAVLGNSAVFGTGVSDAHTMSAQLQQQLQAASSASVSVTNLGVEASTFAAEVRLIALKLSRIDASDVIFLNGANDFLLNGWLPEAGGGTVFQHDTIRTRLANRVGQSLTVAALRRLLRAYPQPSPDLPKSAVTRALAAYSEARLDAERFCAASQLRCVFALQPIITDRKQPTYPELLDIESRAFDFPGYGAAYRDFAAKVVAAFPSTTDLSVAIADSPDVMFLDWGHLTPAGNAALAKALVRVLP